MIQAMCDICDAPKQPSELNVLQARYATKELKHICDECKAKVEEYKETLKLAPLKTEARLTKQFMEKLQANKG